MARGRSRHCYGKRVIKVYCPDCGWIDESDPGIKLLNIEEDLCGRDQVTFRCSCGRENKSLRVG